jgi:hypothetical protein
LIVLGEHERIHLHKAGVLLRVEPHEIDEQADGAFQRRAFQPEGEREPPRLAGLKRESGLHPLFHDLLRRLFGDLLDLHAALGGDHHHVAPRPPVEQYAEIELLADRHPVGHVHRAHRLSRLAGLDRDEHAAFSTS